MSNTHRSPVARLGAMVAIVAMFVLLAVAQAASAAEFEGPVLSKNRDAHTFRMNPENHANVTIKVNGQTKYQRLDGFGDIHPGLDVEVIASRQDGDWLASKVEKRRNRSGGGGGDDR